MGGFIARLLINGLGLFVASLLIPGIHIGDIWAILFTALLFGAVNALIRPLVMFFTCLVNILTLGLFTLVVNAVMLWLTSWAAQIVGLAFRVDDFLSAFLGALIIGVISFIMTRLIR